MTEALSVHPFGDQIKVVMETRSEQQGEFTWDLDEQGIQLGRELRNHPAMAEGSMGRGCEAARSQVAEWEGSCGSGRCLSKGLCSQADFSGDGPARSQQQCWAQEAPGTYRKTLSCWSEGRSYIRSV